MISPSLVDRALLIIRERQDLLLELLRGQRRTSDPDTMMRAAAEAMVRFLSCDRAGFFELRDEDTAIFLAGASGSRLPLLTGEFPTSGVGAGYLAEIRAGKIMGISDVRVNPLTADSRLPELGIVSCIGVPIIRNGGWHAGFYVHHSEPREWTADEIAVATEVGDLTWDAVERARAEAALKQSDERLNFALDAGGAVGTWDWDVAADKVYANPRFAKYFSVDPAAAAEGAPVALFVNGIHPDDRPMVQEAIDGALRSGGDFECEYRSAPKDGTVLWLHARGHCHMDANGNPARFPGVIFDITTRKQAQEAIRQQWQTFDAALSHIPDFVYVFDLAGRFTYANQALLSLWGKTLDDAVGKDFYELEYADELAAQLQRQVQEVIQSKKPVRDTTPYTSPSGKTGYYEYIFVPVFGANGEVESVAGATRDFTDQKMAEDNERQFRTLAETIPNLAWMAHADGHIFWYNRRWYEYTGTTAADMEGWGWQKVHDPKVLPEVLARWTACIASGTPFEMVFPLKGTDGSFGTFLTRVEPVRDDEGRVVRWFGTNTDISEQRQREEELRKANRELEEFAYVASHDLQEPLRMVNIYAHMILKKIGTDDPALVQYQGFVQQGVVRMETLIQDLLTFSRTIHKDDAPTGVADLSEALADALTLMKGAITEIGAKVQAQNLPRTRGETGQLGHVFQNLLSNSVKYRRENVPLEITISAERRGDECVISFRDNGLGFDQQYATRIFGLFKRLYKEEFPGTGLGLAICQRIVEKYGGHIWAEGRPGDGATFHFSLPIEEKT